MALSDKLKVCLVSSAGGHFKQLIKISPAWKEYERFYVLFYRPTLDSFKEKEKVFFVINPSRNIFLFMANFFQSLYIFLREMPDLVISTGAGVAVAMCYIAKAFGRKVIFVEDWCVVNKPSLAGRFIYPVCDLFIVQRESLKEFYPRAVFGGELF